MFQALLLKRKQLKSHSSTTCSYLSLQLLNAMKAIQLLCLQWTCYENETPALLTCGSTICREERSHKGKQSIARGDWSFVLGKRVIPLLGTVSPWSWDEIDMILRDVWSWACMCMPGQVTYIPLLSVPGPLSMTFVGWSIWLSSWFEGILHVRFRIAYIVSERVWSPFVLVQRQVGLCQPCPYRGFALSKLEKKNQP